MFKSAYPLKQRLCLAYFRVAALAEGNDLQKQPFDLWNALYSKSGYVQVERRWGVRQPRI